MLMVISVMPLKAVTGHPRFHKIMLEVLQNDAYEGFQCKQETVVVAIDFKDAHNSINY